MENLAISMEVTPNIDSTINEYLKRGWNVKSVNFSHPAVALAVASDSYSMNSKESHGIVLVIFERTK